MELLFKVLVGVSSHYRELKSGELKYQKKRPTNPVWRILVVQEPAKYLHIRLFSEKPSAAAIDRTLRQILPEENQDLCKVVIPDVVEKLCPSLRERLICEGFPVYLPSHGFAAGARASREFEKTLDSLACYLNLVRESMASIGEIQAASGHPQGIFSVVLGKGRISGKSCHEVCRDLADQITHNRGRDPEEGYNVRRNESRNAPLNRGDIVPSPEDVLAKVLRETEPGLEYRLTEWGQDLRKIALALRDIQNANTESRNGLLQNLGKWIVGRRFDDARRGVPENRRLMSNLFIDIPDKRLLRTISVAIKVALKGPVPLENKILCGLASQVKVNYPSQCKGTTLRGIPAHNHIEKMILGYLRNMGHVVVDPCLRPVKNHYISHPVFPGFPYWQGYLSSRTPFSPAGSFIKIQTDDLRMQSGLLIAWVLTSADCWPSIDQKLALEMTDLVNERLSRTGKGVTCRIGPWRPLGEFMDIGE